MYSTPKPKQPKPTAAHRRLEVFIGDWHAEGTSYGDGQDAADPRAAGVQWTSDESYEWLPDGIFVLHRWDAQMGKHEFKGAEVIGYDESEGGYFTHMFDNAGHPHLCQTTAQTLAATSGASQKRSRVPP